MEISTVFFNFHRLIIQLFNLLTGRFLMETKYGRDEFFDWGTFKSRELLHPIGKTRRWLLFPTETFLSINQTGCKKKKRRGWKILKSPVSSGRALFSYSCLFIYFPIWKITKPALFQYLFCGDGDVGGWLRKEIQCILKFRVRTLRLTAELSERKRVLRCQSLLLVRTRNF